MEVEIFKMLNGDQIDWGVESLVYNYEWVFPRSQMSQPTDA